MRTRDFFLAVGGLALATDLAWAPSVLAQVPAQAQAQVQSPAPAPVPAPAPEQAPAVSHETHQGSIGVDVVAQGNVVDLLVAESNGGAVGLVHRRSRDGGRTWEGPNLIPSLHGPIAPPQRGMDPQITADGSRILVAWTARGTSEWGTGPIATATSEDGGKNWIPAVTPADDRTTGGHGFIDLDSASGRFHAVWLDSRGGRPGLRYSTSTDMARSWSANVSLDQGTCECCWNEVLVSGSEILVAYRDDTPRDQRVVASRDRGKTWSDRGRPGAFDWNFDGCPHVGGALARQGDVVAALTWTGSPQAGLFVATSRDAGEWSAPVRLGDRFARHGDLVVSRDRLMAVWDQTVGELTSIFASTSSDRGRSWSAPEALIANSRATPPSRGRDLGRSSRGLDRDRAQRRERVESDETRTIVVAGRA